MKKQSSYATALAFCIGVLLLCSCQKKTNTISPVYGNVSEEQTAGRSTGGGTTSTPTPTFIPAKILGACPIVSPLPSTRNVYALNAFAYGTLPPYISTYGESFHGVASYTNVPCVISKTDGSPTMYISYNSGTPDVLTLGSTSGPAFNPEEIEMTAASSSNVYAIYGNTVYAIQGIGTGNAYGQSIFVFPASWASYRKTICYSPTANTLKLFVAETAAPKGSSVTQLKQYTLSNLNSVPNLSSLEATITGITYANTQDLSSFSLYMTTGSLTGCYHVVICDATAGTYDIYQITGTAASYVASFPGYVKDCSLLNM